MIGFAAGELGPPIQRVIPDGVYVIVSSLNESKAIDISGSAQTAGAPATLYDIHGGANQQFFIQQDKQDGCYTILNLNSWKCLGFTGDVSSGAQIFQNDFINTDNQKWILKLTTDGYI